MKTKSLALATLMLTATSAIALPTDADGNGTYSMAEMMQAYPDLTEDEFATIDANGDGEVDAVELADAVANEIIAG